MASPDSRKHRYAPMTDTELQEDQDIEQTPELQEEHINSSWQMPRHKTASLALLSLVAGIVASMVWVGTQRQVSTEHIAVAVTEEVKLFKMPDPIDPEESFHPVWINREPEYLKLVERVKMTKKHTEDGDQLKERRLDVSTALSDPLTCMLRLNRFKAMNVMSGSVTFPINQDPQFPAAAESIAPVGANCGDTAQGINKPCSDYNTWGNMVDISQAHGKPFQVFPADGMPSAVDVTQGQMGTCYFLGAILSVAYSNPQLIKDMFVRTDLWSKGIITTKWLVNGMESMIEVDTSIPARDGRYPFFVSPRWDGNAAWWPGILEKAWSKIYTSFQAAEGGQWPQAVAAITRAPTRSVKHEQVQAEKDAVWAMLVEGTTEKWPMGGGTVAGGSGLASGHAYSVLEASVHPTYGNTVTLRNPWGVDKYNGIIPNPGSQDGIFTMTFDEYYQAVASTAYAKVRAGYHVTSAELTHAQDFQATYKFQVTSNDPFTVSLVWPGARIMQPCKELQPQYIVGVRKAGTSGLGATTVNAYGGVNAAVTEVPPAPGAPPYGGAGTYEIVVSTHFPSGVQASVYVNVYAAEAIDLYAIAGISFQTLSLGMYGANVGGAPCDYIMMQGSLARADWTKTVGGMATYHSWDGRYFFYWHAATHKWLKNGKSEFDLTVSGEKYGYYTAQLTQDDMACGCEDSSGGVAIFSPPISCARVHGNIKYSNVRCDKEVEYTKEVQGYCPRTCSANPSFNELAAACNHALPSPLTVDPAPAPASSSPTAGPVPVPTAAPEPAPAPTTPAPATQPPPSGTEVVQGSTPAPASPGPAPADNMGGGHEEGPISTSAPLVTPPPKTTTPALPLPSAESLAPAQGGGGGSSR